MSDYLIFGEYYQNCRGDCIFLFKLKTHTIRADREEIPAVRDHYAFQELAMDPKYHTAVKHLMDLVPPLLLAARQSEFGVPDPGRQGALIIQIQQSGSRRTWVVDKSVERLPPFLVPFILEVKSAIYFMRNG